MTVPTLSPGLQIGDRLPNFQRHDADRQPVVYYDVHCGEPLVLLIALRADAAVLATALATLAELDQAAAAVMIVGDPDVAARFREATGTRLRVLADDGAIVGFIVGDEAPAGDILTLALDANAHLRGRWWGCPDARELATVLPAAEAGRLVTAAAPALIIPNAFEPAFCRHLIDVYRADNEPSGVLRLVAGKMVYQADDDTKIRREHRIADPELMQAVEGRLMRRVLPEIEWAYNYRVTRYEAFKVVCYDAETGGHFRSHRDNNGPDTAHRRFALTLNLNSDEYEGGELRFPEYGPDRYKPPTGGAVVFSCSLAHAALAVTSGVRYALVSFLYGSDSTVQHVDREDRIAQPR